MGWNDHITESISQPSGNDRKLDYDSIEAITKRSYYLDAIRYSIPPADSEEYPSEAIKAFKGITRFYKIAPACNHKYVDVGFMHRKIVCSLCDKEQPKEKA